MKYLYAAWIMIGALNMMAQPGAVLSLNTVTSNDAGISGSQTIQFGSSITSIGDLNNDGVEDIAVGASAEGANTNQGRVVHIIFLNSDGTVKNVSTIGSGNGGFNGSTGFRGRFGKSLAYLGDIDGNGTIEIAVGNPAKSIQGSQEGSVWILSVDSSGTVQQSVELTQGSGGFTGTLDSEEAFGHSLATMPDVDNDGVPELIVGAPDKSLSATDDGRVYLLLLNSNGTVKSYKTYDDQSNLLSLSGQFRFGESVGSVDDLDGNGIPEILVGTPGGGKPIANTGAVWTLFLDAQLDVTSVSEVNHQTSNFPSMVDSVGVLGYSIASLGEINGDGIADIAIGVLGGFINPTSTNLVALLFLNTAGGIDSSAILEAKSGTPFSGLSNPGIDFSGSVLAPLSDINGDGKRDIAAGAPVFQSGKGQIHILTLDGISHINTPEFEKEALDISLFPNPTTGKIQLELPEAFHRQELSLQFIDHAGKVVLQKKLKPTAGKSMELEVPLPPGSYLLQINAPGQSVTRKLLIAP